MNEINRLANMIKSSNNICVFTGAGISCPSGIPDFRSADGLYNGEKKSGYMPEEIISHSFFLAHTDLFYEFYKSKMVYPDAQPNKAHLFFAELEKKGKDISVVTQNIDGLHQKAGSKNVFELHGSVHRNYCTKCGKFFSSEDIMKTEGVPHCDIDGAVIKPDVVLYEEPLNTKVVDSAIKAIENAETMMIIGTSLAVYPAASYIRYFKGKNLILINKSKTPYDDMAGLAIYDDVINVIEHLKKDSL